MVSIQNPWKAMSSTLYFRGTISTTWTWIKSCSANSKHTFCTCSMHGENITMRPPRARLIANFPWPMAFHGAGKSKNTPSQAFSTKKPSSQTSCWTTVQQFSPWFYKMHCKKNVRYINNTFRSFSTHLTRVSSISCEYKWPLGAIVVARAWLKSSISI